MSAQPFDPSEVHVWHASTAAFADASVCAASHPLLSREEAARHAAFRFERDQRSYLATRALCRVTLARYADVDPSALTFRTNAHGRPEIAGPARAAHLRFNLTNTDGRVACVVAIGRDVGIDMETLARETPALELAEKYFAPAEIADLRRLDGGARSQRFVAYWTSKEAYAKARGLGLSMPLDHAAFTFDADGSIAVRFDASLDDTPAQWQFAHLSLPEWHRVAVAIGCTPSERIALVVREVGEHDWPGSR